MKLFFTIYLCSVLGSLVISVPHWIRRVRNNWEKWGKEMCPSCGAHRTYQARWWLYIILTIAMWPVASFFWLPVAIYGWIFMPEWAMGESDDP